MIRSNVLAGLVAGVVLGVIFIGYLALRGEAFARVMQEDSDLGTMTTSQMRWVLVAMFGGGALLWGIGAGLIYGWVASPSTYRLLAGGAAVVLSLLALISKTPLIPDKIFMNFAVAINYGFLLPWLTG